MSEHHDIKDIFYSLYGALPCHFLLQKGLSANFLKILKALCTNISGNVRAYNHISLFLLEVVAKGSCYVAPFLLDFAIDDFPETTVTEVMVVSTFYLEKDFPI